VNNKIKLSFIIYAVVFTNLIELLLKKLNFDSYIILVGFRFHLSLILPFFFIFRFNHLHDIKKFFIKPFYNRTFQPLSWIFIPLIIIFIVFYIIKKIKIGDPDYFYEFGLSSIIDYPIYFLWNLPQLLMFLIFLFLIQPVLKFKVIFTVIITILLFVSEFIPLYKTKINLFGIISLLFSAVGLSLLIKYFQNIYWISIIIFSIFWSSLLAFGCTSQTLIHILFAATYNSWEGFFKVSNGFVNYFLPLQLLITIILISFSAVKKKTNI